MKYLFLLSIIIFLSACTKHGQKPGCPTNQACTAIFASVSMKFVDKDDNPVGVKNLTVVNLRTNKTIAVDNVTNPTLNPGVYTVVSDSNKSDFSTEGDDVQVSATDTVTNQTKTAMLKIAGGCSCHINQVSGPNQMKFD